MASIIAAFVLAPSVSDSGVNFIGLYCLPFWLAALGLFTSFVGILVIYTRDTEEQADDVVELLASTVTWGLTVAVIIYCGISIIFC